MNTIEDDVNVASCIEEIQFLCSSQNRVKILDSISESPRSSTEIQNELGIPRTTLRRNLVELEARHWIKERPEKNDYQLLNGGEIVLDAVSVHLQQMSVATDVSKFLSDFPDNASIDRDVIEEGAFTFVSPSNPYKIPNQYQSLFMDSETVRTIRPSLNPILLNKFQQKSVQRPHELICKQESLENLSAVEQETVEDISQMDGVQIISTNDCPEFGVSIFDDAVSITVYDDMVRPSGFVYLYECPVARDWALKKFENR